MVKILRDIDFGEPDANAEYFMSLRSNQEPMYIKAYHNSNTVNYDQFINGSKFIITGQKGTGKTAILRYMEHQCREKSYLTEFVVFKNEIVKEAELLHVDYTNINGSVVDEDKLKKEKFYYHSIKRVMMFLIVSKLKSQNSAELGEAEQGLIASVIGSSGTEALRSAFDSVLNILQSATLDITKVAKGALRIEPSQLVKKSNDDLLNKIIRVSQKQKPAIRIFFDEMHFAFRDKNSLRSDAALVRDTILAAQTLNERFTREGIDIVVYIALRREFLDQPEIAQADIVHVVESYGETISWENFPASRNHPMFEFITLRFRASLTSNFSRNRLFETYMSEIDPLDLIEYTWSKPRDIVRFFKFSQSMYGGTIVINPGQYKSIIKNYSAQAWREIKSALAAFIPIDAIPILETGLKSLIPGQFDGSQKLTEFTFHKAIKPAFDLAKKNGVTYSLIEFGDILYIVGIIYYTYTDANGRFILQQYHRGNLNPTKTGEVRIHEAVAKALS